MVILGDISSRDEGQEGDERDPQPSTKQKDRSHSKTKKSRRERRHGAQEGETAASTIPPAISKHPEEEMEPQSQVQNT